MRTTGAPAVVSLAYRALLLAALGGACHGAESALELSIGAGVVHQNYRATERFESGAVFNEETGALRGARAEVGAQRGAWGFSLEGMQTSGTLDYDGRSQIGLPLQTQTDLRHTAWSAFVVRRFLGELLELGGGIGGREMDRRIRSTPPSALYPFGTQGLNERLQSTEWRLAARVYWPTMFGRFSIEGDGLRNVNGRLKADFLGTFDVRQVDVPDWSTWVARVGWTHRFGAVQLRAYYEWQRFDVPASGTYPLTSGGNDAGATFRYPGSEQRIQSIGLQLGYVH